MDPYYSSNNPFNISPQASTEEKSIHDNFDLNKKNVEKRLINRPTSRSLEDRGILRNPGKANSDKILQLNFVKTRDNIRKKISTRPEKAELIKSHILRDASCDQEKEKNRIKNMLDMRMLNRPGSLELIQKNILKVNPLLESKVLNGEIEYPKVESGAPETVATPVTFVPHQMGGVSSQQNMYNNSLLTTLQNSPSLLSSITEIDISTSLSELSTLKETIYRQPTSTPTTTSANSSTTQIKFHKAGKLGKYSIHNAEFQPQKAREYQQNQMLQFEEIQGQREQNMKKLRSELEHTQNSLLNRLNINELKAECKLRSIPSSNISKKQLVMRLQPFEDEILQKRKCQVYQHDTKFSGSNISPPPSVLSHSSSSYAATISHPPPPPSVPNTHNNSNLIHHCLSEPVIYNSLNNHNTNHIHPHNQNFISNNYTDNISSQNQFPVIQHDMVNNQVNNSVFPKSVAFTQKNNNANRHSLIMDNSHQLGMYYNNLNHSINYPHNSNHVINGYFNPNHTISSSTTYLTWSPSPIKQSSFSFSNSLNDSEYFNYNPSANHHTNSVMPISNSFLNNCIDNNNNTNTNANIIHQNDASQDLSLYNTPNDSSSLANSFEHYNSQVNTLNTNVSSNNTSVSTVTFPPYLSILPLPNNCEQKFKDITQEIYELSNVIAKMTKLKNSNESIDNCTVLEYSELLNQMLNSIQDAVEFINKEFTKYNTITRAEHNEQDNWLTVLYQYVENLKNQIVKHKQEETFNCYMLENLNDAEIAKIDLSGFDIDNYVPIDMEFPLNELKTPDAMDLDLEELLDSAVN